MVLNPPPPDIALQTIPTILYRHLGDNKSVVLNTSVPSSILKKKHCAINYHRVRESIAAGIVRFFHIPSHKNIADCLTKPLAGNIAYRLLKPVLFANPGETLWPGENVDEPGASESIQKSS